jgi:dolichol-phosphate mannosyltransferase
MKIGLVIPTYNEAENLQKLIPVLLALPLDLHLLVVDDGSPDGSGQLADQFSLEHPDRVNVLHRPGKMGFASAYLQGFRFFMDQHMDAIGQMDADLSHDPAELVVMEKALAGCGMVIGSRYTAGGSVDRQWSYFRRWLSAFGNSYARTILGLPYRDITTGYRLWRSSALAEIPLDHIHSDGYVFLIELTYLAHRFGVQVAEVPIYFADRKRGKTKMTFKIQLEAAWRVWQLPFIHRHTYIKKSG